VLYKVDPLQCPRYGGAMRLVAFSIERASIVRIRSHLGEATDPPRLAAIRDPPEAARAAFAPQFALQAFDVPADVIPDDEDQRQDVAWSTRRGQRSLDEATAGIGRGRHALCLLTRPRWPRRAVNAPVKPHKAKQRGAEPLPKACVVVAEDVS